LHEVLQLVPVHVYGVQSVVPPLGMTSECMPSQLAASRGTHSFADALHWNRASQSASLAHDVPQAAPAHAYGEHVTWTTAGHVPVRLQLAANVPVPAAHDGARHAVSSPASPMQDVRTTPSHRFALHASAVDWPHPVRPPTGRPAIARHVPGFALALHVSHWPVQAVSQHRPSAQKPDAQSGALAHACASVERHWPTLLHVRLPVHESGSCMSVTGVQTPGPAARLHAAHVPHDAVSQHVPSTQCSVSQSVSIAHVPPRK
jgi:hypothetical protein